MNGFGLLYMVIRLLKRHGTALTTLRTWMLKHEWMDIIAYYYIKLVLLNAILNSIFMLILDFRYET